MYKHNKNKNTNLFRKKKALWVLLSVLLILGSLFLILELTGKLSFFSHNQSSSDDVQTTSEQLNEEQEYQETVEGSSPDDTKERIIQNQEKDNEGGAAVKNVTPIVTSAYNESGVVTARGFIDGIVESDGTCTFIFNGPQVLEVTSKGTAGANSVNCIAETPRSNLPGSNWNVRLNYSSETARGSSEEIKVGL